MSGLKIPVGRHLMTLCNYGNINNKKKIPETTITNKKYGICIEFVFPFHLFIFFLSYKNHISGVMVSVLASSAVDRGFEPRSGQTKDYEIGICCFSAKYAALKRKSKDWLARNQNNVSEWSDMSTRGLLFQ